MNSKQKQVAENSPTISQKNNFSGTARQGNDKIKSQKGLAQLKKGLKVNSLNCLINYVYF